jgi:hypothetical protein
MPLINDEFRLAYFSIPKVASTSLKHVFYELDTGQKFSRGGKDRPHIHSLYPAGVLSRNDFERTKDHWKFTVFRDPVKRIISAYSNRVVHQNVLENQSFAQLRAAALGLNLRPDLEEFCLKLDRYRILSRTMRHHTRPYEKFVGPDLSRLDAVYTMENLDDLAKELSERTGKDITFPRRQTGGPKFSVSELTPAALTALNKFTAADYRLMGGLYQPATARNI